MALYVLIVVMIIQMYGACIVFYEQVPSDCCAIREMRASLQASDNVSSIKPVQLVQLLSTGSAIHEQVCVRPIPLAFLLSI